MIKDTQISQVTLEKLRVRLNEYRRTLKPIEVRVDEITVTHEREPDRNFIESRHIRLFDSSRPGPTAPKNKDAAMLTEARLNWILNHSTDEILISKLQKFLSSIKDSWTFYKMINVLSDKIKSMEKEEANKKQVELYLRALSGALEGWEKVRDFYRYNIISNALNALGNPSGRFIYTQTGNILNPGAGHWEDTSYYNGSMSAMGDSKEWISADEIRDWVKVQRDQAMSHSQITKDKAALAKDLGGIDLNQISVRRTGKTINMQFDPAQLSALEQSGFEGFRPVITSITNISSALPLLGVGSGSQEEMLAKG